MKRRTTRNQSEPPKSSIFDVECVAEDNEKAMCLYHHITMWHFVTNAQNAQNGDLMATGNAKELKSDPWNEFV